MKTKTRVFFPFRFKQVDLQRRRQRHAHLHFFHSELRWKIKTKTCQPANLFFAEKETIGVSDEFLGLKIQPKKLWSLFGGLHACTYKKENKARVCAWKLFSLEGQISSWAKSPRNTFSRPFFGVLLCLVAGKRRRMDARYSSGDWCRGHYCVQQPTTHLLATKYPKKKWLIASY